MPTGTVLRCLLIVLSATFWFGCPSGDPSDDVDRPYVFPMADLVAVDLVDDLHAVVASHTGEIYFTRDAGDTWYRARVPATPPLESLVMIDSKAGWAVGEGVILRTDDAGESWRRQRLPGQGSSLRLRSVSAVDSERAIAIGENDVQIETRDGGGLWTASRRRPKTEPPPASPLRRVFCRSQSTPRCWSVGATLLLSTDFGQKWQRLEIEDYAQIAAMQFSAGQVELAQSEIERLTAFSRSNRHRNDLQWQIEPSVSRSELDFVGGQQDPEVLFDVIAARIQEARSVIEDAGVSHEQIVALGAPPWEYEDSLDDDPERVERYWASLERLESNLAIRLVSEPVLFGVDVNDAGLGIAVGEAGAVLRSEDGGERWETIEPATPHDLFAVACGHERVVAAGAQGGLWLSEDAGQTWRPRDPKGQAAFFDSLRSISFSPSKLVAMVVGDHGRILRSLDGGENWRELAPTNR